MIYDSNEELKCSTFSNTGYITSAREDQKEFLQPYGQHIPNNVFRKTLQDRGARFLHKKGLKRTITSGDAKIPKMHNLETVISPNYKDT